MGQSVSECKACKPLDPVADTVKVQMPAAPAATEEDMENERLQRETAAADESRLEEERLERERLQAEESRLAEEAERNRAELEAEQTRKQAAEAEAERIRQEEEAERLRQEKLLAEKKAKLERERAAEAERVKAEQIESAKQRAEDEAKAAKQAVDDFLKVRGFKGIGLPKKAVCGAPVYPLHLAVEENNVDVVKAMLSCGADKDMKNAGKKTPLDLAEKCNKSGSHAAVVSALRGGA